MIASLALYAFSQFQRLGRTANPLINQPAPEVAFTTVDGQAVRLSDHKGQVVLLDLWATWCGPCRKSLPHIQELSVNPDLAKKGLVVWAVNAQEKPATVAKYLQENKYTFTVPMDTQDQMGNLYGAYSYPTTIIVGRDGLIKSVFVGYGPGLGQEITAAVEQALAEPGKK